MPNHDAVVEPIEIAVALLTRPDGKAALVRKRGTTTFIQPGGKLEPGEEPAHALCRVLARRDCARAADAR